MILSYTCVKSLSGMVSIFINYNAKIILDDL